VICAEFYAENRAVDGKKAKRAPVRISPVKMAFSMPQIYGERAFGCDCFSVEIYKGLTPIIETL